MGGRMPRLFLHVIELVPVQRRAAVEIAPIWTDLAASGACKAMKNYHCMGLVHGLQISGCEERVYIPISLLLLLIILLVHYV